MGNLIDGVERRLRPTERAKYKSSFDTFKKRFNGRGIEQRERRVFEKELETLLESNASLRAASKRYVLSILKPTLRRAAAALKAAHQYLNMRRFSLWLNGFLLVGLLVVGYLYWQQASAISRLRADLLADSTSALQMRRQIIDLKSKVTAASVTAKQQPGATNGLTPVPSGDATTVHISDH
jgi:hypothetical protein